MPIEGIPWNGLGLPRELDTELQKPHYLTQPSRSFPLGVTYIPISGMNTGIISIFIERVSGGAFTELRLQGYVGPEIANPGGWTDMLINPIVPGTRLVCNILLPGPGGISDDPRIAYRVKATSDAVQVANVNIWVENFRSY